MKALQRNFYFFTAVLALSSCASFENLTDDRTRAEDDEMYWNGKELFYDNTMVANTAGGAAGDDYYDPNSATRANSVNGGTNPRASFNPISGWQLSYGLNAFSNYYNGGYGMGFGGYSPFNNFGGFGNSGFNSFGYSPFGCNSYGYGYSPYSAYNGFGGGYGYNPYGYGMGGLGWGGYGYGNGWYGNNVAGGGSSGTEPATVTHNHRTPMTAGTGNSSSYHRGVLQKNLVQPISETARTPQPVANSRANDTHNYASPSYSSPSRSTPEYSQPARTGPSRTTPTPSRATPNYNSPSYSSPSRQSPSYNSPSYSSPSHSSPSRPAPSYSSPSRSSSPMRSSPSYSAPSHSSPSHSTSPGRRP